MRLLTVRLSPGECNSTAYERLPSRPARPASWKYASMELGMSMCMTVRTSGLSMPMPNALVATTTRYLSWVQAFWRSSLTT